MTTNRKQARNTRLSGHGLWSEGWPVEADQVSNQGWRPGRYRADVGRGLCECGEMSEVLDSASQRKAWHKTHKEQVRASLVAAKEPDPR